MRAIKLVLALAVVPGIAAAQGGEAQHVFTRPAPAITCADEFRWLRDYAERNYSGFEYKVTNDRRGEYENLVSALARDAAAAKAGEACDDILGRWVAFFGDGHLSVGRRGAAAAAPVANESADAIRARYADAPRVDVTEAQARARLDGLGEARHELEGIWEMQGGNYRGVVLREDSAGTSFRMAILRADSVWWMPGQVKAVFAPGSDGAYATRFYMRDHSEQRWTARVKANVLLINNGAPWLRVYPVRAGDLTADQVAAMENSAFAVRKLAPGTLALHIPSFNDASAMDSLWAAERLRLQGAERLIIDLRGNGGGSDHNFRMLLPLLYTGPIRMVANAVLATEDNIAVYESMAADTALPGAIRESLQSTAQRMRETEGRWFEFEDRMITDLPVLEQPRRVDVIVDRGCASSCEQFLLAARQSRKVTIYGTPSAGILDFGNVRPAQMPGGTLQLYYPTTRSKRLPHAPVDGVGILPQVAIPAGEMDPVGWVLRASR